METSPLLLIGVILAFFSFPRNVSSVIEMLKMCFIGLRKLLKLYFRILKLIPSYPAVSFDAIEGNEDFNSLFVRSLS